MLATPHLGLVPRERHGVVVDQHHATCHTLVVVLQLENYGQLLHIPHYNVSQRPLMKVLSQYGT